MLSVGLDDSWPVGVWLLSAGRSNVCRVASFYGTGSGLSVRSVFRILFLAMVSGLTCSLFSAICLCEIRVESAHGCFTGAGSGSVLEKTENRQCGFDGHSGFRSADGIRAVNWHAHRLVFEWFTGSAFLSKENSAFCLLSLLLDGPVLVCGLYDRFLLQLDCGLIKKSVQAHGGHDEQTIFRFA